ncbi:MAG TPA: DUF2207 domain-containing protein [Vicinamibacterales bacterium]|nr:DUF2207 domain-containing protein [Vicinamibacterales bacterium]
MAADPRARFIDRLRAVQLLGLSAVFAAACAAPPSPGAGRLLEYELTLAIRADGTMNVDERARVEFGAADAGAFHLPISGWHVDGLVNHRTTVDGVTPDGPPADVRAVPGGGLRWSLSADATGTREFRQTYDAAGVLALQGARGQLVWPAVPPGVPVVAARVTVTWPTGSLPAVPPAIEPGAWTAQTSGATTVFTGQEIDAEVDPWLYLDLVLDDLSALEPAWQITERRAGQLMPAFVSAGVFIVIVGVGVLLMVRVS